MSEAKIQRDHDLRERLTRDVKRAKSLPSEQFRKVLRRYRRYSEEGVLEPEMTVRDFFERLTMHGLLDIYAAKSLPVKITWAVLFILASTAFIVGLYQSIQEYISHPVTTTFEYVPMNEMQLPLIYFCPRTAEWLSDKYSTENNTASNATESPTDRESFGDPSHRQKHTDFEWIRAGREAMNASLIFRQCSMNGVSGPCPNITTVYDGKYGLCFIVNETTPQTKAGRGLRLMVSLDPKNIPNADLNSLGGRLQFTDSWSPFSGEELVAAPGFSTKVSLSSQAYYAEGTKHIHGCGSTQLRSLTLPYSFENCILDCFNHEIVKVCNCILPYDPGLSDDFRQHRPCIASDVDSCVEKMLNKTKASCYDDCPQECSYWEYSASISGILRYPSKLYLQGLASRGDYQRYDSAKKLEETALVLDISHAKLGYTSITQSASFSFNALLAQLGGQGGLWFGASLFSFVQIALYFMQLCHTFRAEKRKVRRGAHNRDGTGTLASQEDADKGKEDA